jgi:hypothetical protein
MKMTPRNQGQDEHQERGEAGTDIAQAECIQSIQRDETLEEEGQVHSSPWHARTIFSGSISTFLLDLQENRPGGRDTGFSVEKKNQIL